MARFKNFIVLFYFIFSSLLVSVESSPTTTVNIPMRDGKELIADIYLPEAEAEKLPCILLRSPAGRKANTWLHFAELAKSGYAVVIQDTRSAMDPEGKTVPYLSDGWGELQDGYDTVQWLAQSKWTNGQIGTLGFSALGITQLMLAPSAPPALKCQYIGVAASDLYHHAIFLGGQVLKDQVEGWLRWYAKDPSVHGYLCSQPFYNEFWSSFNTLAVAHRVQVPALHYGGWFDIFIQGTIDGFKERQEKGGIGAKGTQKLLIGPWVHFWPKNIILGDFEVPEIGRKPPVDVTPKRWFDHYLKGIPNKIDEIPPITYYVMGPFDGTPSTGNVWRHANSWPIPAQETPFYLTADQKLIPEIIPGLEKTYTYFYDPKNPVPTLGGRNLFLEAGPKDQRKNEQRSDVLVFTSEPMEEDLEVTGRITAKLFFSSDRSNTDVVVWLTDVYPDGRSILIADGIHSTGYHACLQNKTDRDPSIPNEVDIDLWSTSIVFAKGHSIRVAVSSSNYPRYEKNLNIGLIGNQIEQMEIAKNNIHVGPKMSSHLILPLVRRGNQILVTSQEKQ